MTGPDWAQGCCAECRFGLLTPPPIPKSMLSTLQARRAQARRGELSFCTCKAGVAMQHKLLEESSAVEENTPTMHFEKAA